MGEKLPIFQVRLSIMTEDEPSDRVDSPTAPKTNPTIAFVNAISGARRLSEGLELSSGDGGIGPRDIHQCARENPAVIHTGRWTHNCAAHSAIPFSGVTTVHNRSGCPERKSEFREAVGTPRSTYFTIVFSQQK